MTTHIPYKDTGFYSSLVLDYLSHHEQLRDLYRHKTDLNGVSNAIEARKYFPDFRNILCDQLTIQYKNLNIHPKLQENLELLKEENTFTVTTAHQPNIFTGPLYFIYKILHVIKIANELKTKFHNKNFVPVYYMGSEDADIDELNNITVQGKKYVWQTTQTGAVGRMIVDEKLLKLIEELQGQIGVNKYGNEWINILRNTYTAHKTIQQCTLELINTLFGKYGLIILIPDNASLKKLFNPVIKKELLEQFSEKEVMKNAQKIQNKGYKIQTSGRDVNLFYLEEKSRERIQKKNDYYEVLNSNKQFSEKEILQQVDDYPEKFSGNVILRGVFQETILPNTIFVGGGGELAYWLELKNVFDKVGVPYPILILRNSFLLVNGKQKKIIDDLNIKVADLFKKESDILDIINAKNGHSITIENEIETLKKTYATIKSLAQKADSTLAQHTIALFTTAQNKLQHLQKKINSAQRKKLETEKQKISKLKSQLFPGRSLQERVENIAYFYSLHGPHIFDLLLENSESFQQEFSVLEIP